MTLLYLFCFTKLLKVTVFNFIENYFVADFFYWFEPFFMPLNQLPFVCLRANFITNK